MTKPLVNGLSIPGSEGPETCFNVGTKPDAEDVLLIHGVSKRKSNAANEVRHLQKTM